MIYFWKDRELARHLRANTVAEKDKFIYLLLYIFVPAFFGLLGYTPGQHAAYIPLNLSRYLWLGYLLLPIGLFIFYLFYQTNARGDGVHFIERYICFSFPVAIRVAVIAGLLSIVASVISIVIFIIFFQGDSGHASMVVIPVVGIVVFGYYIARMRMLFKIASGQKE